MTEPKKKTLREVIESCIDYDDIKYLPLWEMANLTSRMTGLPKGIWILDRLGSHGPRIKISPWADKFDPDKLYPMSVGDNPEMEIEPPIKEISKSDQALIKKWVVLNKKALTDFCYGRIDIGQLTPLLKKL